MFLKAVFMVQADNHSYDFGRFRLKTSERVLLREGELVPLTPKVFDILITLVENRGQVVEKDDLMKRVWPNTFVEEGNLTQNISLLRKALGESSTGVQFIETVPRRGYRFVAAISESWQDGLSLLAPKNGTRATSSSGNGHHVPAVDVTETPPPIATLKSLPPAAGKLGAIKRRTPTFVLLGAVVVVAIIGTVYFTSWGKAGTAAPIQSIAVLPFIDEASDAEGEYIN